ncbi:hypothetical protein LTR36_010632 [Oleoguttula mirabilis]|uniref:Uncharacterized protein n=1 Tax=Oleoguttula mirabilis TaxID=1507867 RepID=A0AAV9JSE0_9PEZI|nr:hypothetical protein LTR36_010632 [Oleoguttula mirabilis]
MGSEARDSHAGKGRVMKLLVAGFNAHAQLDAQREGDVRAFGPVRGGPDDEHDVDVLFAGWSTTVLHSPTAGIWSLGHQKLGLAEGATMEKEAIKASPRPTCAFGDHNGLIGLLSEDGRLHWATQHSASRDNLLVSVTTDASPGVSHIAPAGNERVAVTFKQAPNGRLCHVVEFEDMEKFQTWYEDPSGEDNHPERHHMLPGRPKQLLANTATFALLMEGGEVYSWGDARHQSLGRSTTAGGDGVVSAEEPGVVEALGGLRIAKVASGGWMSAALSEDGALYLWGASMPGAERSIRCLREAGAGEVVLVDIPGGEEGEPLDVVDVAVGDAHVAAVTADHRLFLVGDNTNGQLGVDSEQQFYEDWTEVEALRDVHVQRVVCGPRATFTFVGSGYDSTQAT